MEVAGLGPGVPEGVLPFFKGAGSKPGICETLRVFCHHRKWAIQMKTDREFRDHRIDQHGLQGTSDGVLEGRKSLMKQAAKAFLAAK